MIGPQNFRVASQNGSSITLAWDAVEGANGYTLERGTESIAVNITETTYTDTLPCPFLTYHYGVSALMTGHAEGPSTLDFTYVVAPEKPKFKYVISEMNAITLCWNKVKHANGYKLYRGDTLIYDGDGDTYRDGGDYALNTEFTYKLVAYNDAGESTAVQTTGKTSDFYLVTNRTQSDVDFLTSLFGLSWAEMTLAQRVEWLYGTDMLPLLWSDGEPITCREGALFSHDVSRTNKGAYNAQDLNRVTAAMDYLVDMFNSAGYSVSIKPVVIDHREELDDGTVKEWSSTTWESSDFPKESDLQKYLANVETLRGVITLFADTPAVPTDLNYMVYQEANDIERILMDMHSLLESMSKVYIRAGMPWAVAGNDIYIRN